MSKTTILYTDRDEKVKAAHAHCKRFGRQTVESLARKMGVNIRKVDRGRDSVDGSVLHRVERWIDQNCNLHKYVAQEGAAKQERRIVYYSITPHKTLPAVRWQVRGLRVYHDPALAGQWGQKKWQQECSQRRDETEAAYAREQGAKREEAKRMAQGITVRQ